MTTADEILRVALEYIRANVSESAAETDTPKGLELDSLDRIDIVIEIETELAVNIEDEWSGGLTGDETLRQISERLAEEINA